MQCSHIYVPCEESLNTLGVAAQTGRRHVNVLVLDLAAEEQVQRPLDQLWLLGTSQGAQRSVALIAVGRAPVEVENLVILLKG